MDNAREPSENRASGTEQRAAVPKPSAGKAKPGARATASGTARKADRPLSMSSEALFAFKSSTLVAADKKQLDELVAKLSNGDYQTIRVLGHTDKIENSDSGEKLSLLRAQAVKQYLVSKGIEARRIVALGQGADDPITRSGQCGKLAGQALHACLAPDRRAEIIVTRALAKKPGGHVVRK